MCVKKETGKVELEYFARENRASSKIFENDNFFKILK